MRKTDAKKLETRDFISVGIFSLIYAVVAFVIGGVAQMTPVTFPFMPMIVALFTGTVFMLYVAKIPKKGALSILGVIAAILLFVTGMFWMMSVFFLVFGVIADFICASADFRSFKKNLLAYCVMALAPMGAYIPMLVMPAQFDAFMKNGARVTSGFNQDLREHAGRCRFAVRAGNRNGVCKLLRQKAEHHGALQCRNTLCTRRNKLRVILLCSRRVHHDLRIADVLRAVTHVHRDAVAANARERVGFIDVAAGDDIILVV